jgi:hypothetical protein
MKKPAIPDIAPQGANMIGVVAALKENVEQITGLRAGQIAALPTTATQAQIITKLNEVIDRMMNR